MKWKRRERESKVCGRELLSQNTFLPLVSCTTFKPKNNPGKKLPYSSMTNSWNFVYTLMFLFDINENGVNEDNNNDDNDSGDDNKTKCYYRRENRNNCIRAIVIVIVIG